MTKRCDCRTYRVFKVDIGDLIVRKDFRRHQIGSQLLRTVENRFRGRGFD